MPDTFEYVTRRKQIQTPMGSVNLMPGDWIRNDGSNLYQILALSVEAKALHAMFDQFDSKEEREATEACTPHLTEPQDGQEDGESDDTKRGTVQRSHDDTERDEPEV